MNPQVIILMDDYRNHPVKVEKKRITIYKQKKMEKESLQKVERAINQWLYSSEAKK